MAAKLDVSSHILVPKHSIASEREIKQLENQNKSYKDLPKIFTTDPALLHLNVKSGDIIKISRKSRTAGETVYYRGVINA